MSEWTVDTLKEHILALLNERDRAVEKALSELHSRLSGMNEFRAALSDQQGHYVTRTEVYAWIGMACAVMTSVFMAIDHFSRK